jgi:hypothetical protein
MGTGIVGFIPSLVSGFITAFVADLVWPEWCTND